MCPRCLAKDIKIDTAAIRQETSEIPEVKRTTEEILEEIQRLRLEISERGAMEGDPMLERYLDSLTTYAGTIVSGDVEDFQERFELLRPLSPYDTIVLSCILFCANWAFIASRNLRMSTGLSHLLQCQDPRDIECPPMPQSRRMEILAMSKIGRKRCKVPQTVDCMHGKPSLSRP